MTPAHPGWGVRLERVGRVIVVAPNGVLDRAGVHRLREVLDSRQGAYDAVVIDLRDLVSVGRDGLALLREQRAWAQRDGIELTIVAGPVARASLEQYGVAGDIPLADDLEQALNGRRAPRPGSAPAP